MTEKDEEFSAISSIQGRIVQMPLEDEFDESDNDDAAIILNKNPCLNTFINFRGNNMHPIIPALHKMMIREGYGGKVKVDEYKIKYEYELYLENKEDPFDSHKLTKKFGVIDEKNRIGTFPGLLMAIESMEYKELSVFWISHELMYGIFGLPPKVPPKADIVARIQVAKMYDKYDNEIKPQPDYFTQTIREVNRLYAKGKADFIAKRYSTSITDYKKAKFMLENLRLANEAQEIEVKEFQIKMSLNLAICYNKIKNPQKACLEMRELERLTSIKDNAKALYTKGRSLLMLNDLNKAEFFLRQSYKLSPDNLRTKQALDEIEELRNKQGETRKALQNFDDALKSKGYITSVEALEPLSNEASKNNRNSGDPNNPLSRPAYEYSNNVQNTMT